MRIELVAERFSTETGVGTERYSAELLAGVRARGVEVEPVASDPSRRRFALALNALTRVPALTLRRMKHAALIHATDPSSAFALPFTGHKTVVTFHDLMPLLIMSGQYRVSDRMFARLAYRLSAMCDAMIAVTEQTKGEMIRDLGVPAGKVRVISEGVSSLFSVSAAPSGRPMTVGYVGDINPRKRLDFLLEGFASLRRAFPDARLTIVGTNIAEYLGSERARLLRLVRGLGLEANVRFTGHVSEQRLVDLYNEMKVLVLPSDYEGFGFPILEAERCGVPVVVREDARISPEVSDACLKVRSPEDLAGRVGELLGRPALHAERVRAGLDHSARFTWERCVDKTVELYRELLTR